MSAPTTTMDFFGQQTRTRRRTFLLIALLMLAVLVIVAAVYPIFAFVVAWVGPYGGAGEREPDWDKMWEMMWRWEMILGVGLAVLAMVTGAALTKIRKLARGGGAAVAEMLGGHIVDADTSDPDERKLLNVVEEMSIAAGMSVPPVYILNEQSSINAFAAGFSPEHAVIGVTRGAVVYLSRDELQGVIAHEFSHILNGDMRLNLRLIGIVHGLMIIALIGYGLLASASSGRRYVSRNERKGRAGAAIMGLVLIGIGMLGVFFGRLIKAAVSRQREFLADAAAVQFTRNPAGLAGALKKIGAHHRGARISAAKAEEASHMFFGRGVTAIGLLDSHPSLKKRIRRIDPGWDGTYPEIVKPSSSTPAQAADSTEQQDDDAVSPGDAVGMVLTGAVLAGGAATQARAASSADTSADSGEARTAANALAQVGQPTAEHLAHARKLREAIPNHLIAAVQESGGGRALVYTLLLHADEDVRKAQWERLAAHAEPAAYELAQRMAPDVARLLEEVGEEIRLILIELAMPALRRLTPEQYSDFRENMNHLIRADRRVSLFEWMMRRVIVHHLEPEITGTDRPGVRYYNLKALADRIACLLSTIAYLGAKDHEQAQRMYAAAGSVLDLELPAMWEARDCDLDVLGEALDHLAQTGLRQKRALLTACATCIAANQRVTTREAELLRAVSASLDVPMPPLLPGQPLA